MSRSSPSPAASTCSRPGRRSTPDAYTSSLAAEDVPFEVVDGVEVRPPMAGVRRRRRGLSRRGGDRLTGHRHRAGGTGDGHAPAAGPSTTAPRSASARRSSRCVRSDDEVDVVTATGTHRCATVVVAADAWTERLVAPLGVELPLTVQREQVTYFDLADAAPFLPGRLPGVDLDGRPELLRLPGLRRRHDGEGVRGLRWIPCRSRHPHVRPRSGGASAASPASWRACSAARSARRGARRRASTRSTPTATSCSIACPDEPAGARRPRRRPRLQVRLVVRAHARRAGRRRIDAPRPRTVRPRPARPDGTGRADRLVHLTGVPASTLGP